MSKARTTRGQVDREAYAQELFAVLVSHRVPGIEPDPSEACRLADEFFEFLEERKRSVAKADGGGDSKPTE